MHSDRTGLWWVAVFASSLAVGAAAGMAKSAEVLELGGPRKVIVRIEDRGVDYAVTATMLPVGAFDEATNALLNRSKAEQYALGGLTKFLADGSGAAARAYTGVTAEDVGLVDGRYALTLAVPKEGIGPPRQPTQRGNKADKPAKASAGDAGSVAAYGETAGDTTAERPRSGTWPGKALFAVVDDYTATIDTLAEDMRSKVARIGEGWEQIAGEAILEAEQALPEIEARVKVRREGVEKSVAALDAVAERGNAAFQRIKAEYTKDLKVMSIERDALDEALRAKQAELVGQVQAINDRLAKAVAEMDSLLESRRKKGGQAQ